jgi:RND family efflux transporter MFP subunit
MMKRLLPLCLTGLLALSAIECRKAGGEENDEPTTKPNVPVLVTTLREGSISEIVAAVGGTDVLRKERVVAPVSGRVLSLKALEGNRVHQGEILVVLRTKEAQSTIEGARMLLQSASTDHQRAEAARALALADSMQPKLVIRAGIDGIIATRSVTEGELVAEQAEILTIVDPASIVFLADVPSIKLSEVRVGLSASVNLPQISALPFAAVVDGILPQADMESQTVRVRLKFTGLTAIQRDLLKTNLQGSAGIVVRSAHGAILVDRNAVLHDDERHAYSIVIMTTDSLALSRPVSVGIQTDSTVQITGEGLKAGMTVVRTGNYSLADSTRLTVQPL